MSKAFLEAISEIMNELDLPDEDRLDTWEWQYLDLVRDILENGDDRVDRTGVGTRALFGRTLDINLEAGFPAVTTKKLAWKTTVSELLFFIEGSSDERRLAEIHHGTRDLAKRTIWTDNAQADYWKPKAQFEGDLGRVYGVQWRSWKKYTKDNKASQAFGHPVFEVTEIDQLAELINKLKTNPTDRRMIISAWNPGELDQMALPPCHMMAQFFVAKGKLSCQMYQRSCDVFLGVPFNIASYALLTNMLAQVCGLGVGRLIMNLGDIHLYSNHLDAASEQLSRLPLTPPKLDLNSLVDDIDAFTMDDIKLIDYQHHAAISAPMAI